MIFPGLWSETFASGAIRLKLETLSLISLVSSGDEHPTMATDMRRRWRKDIVDLV